MLEIKFQTFAKTRLILDPKRDFIIRSQILDLLNWFSAVK